MRMHACEHMLGMSIIWKEAKGVRGVCAHVHMERTCLPTRAHSYKLARLCAVSHVCMQ